MKKLTQFLFLLLAFQVLISSCASTKRRDEQGAIAKLWHNTNSHYNGYFNAKEIMTESLLTLDEQHVDNYTQRLEMFPFLAVDNTSTVSGELDRAIEKVAIVVKKHPYSNWVDDAYLLVGQAQLVKQDYESAEKTLRFMVNEFRPRPKRKKTKRRKGAKEEDSPEEEFVSRREVEENPAQDRRDRLRARKEAQKERRKLNKERDKERKRKAKERDRERKERARARKKGIKLPPRTRPDTSAVTGLEDEPEITQPEQEEGPVGMISIFNTSANLGTGTEAYGKKSGSYALKHRPAFQEGRLWLAWTLIKRDNFDQAQLILEDLRANRGTFPDIRRKAMAVQAFLYLEQESYEEAIPYLEEAAAVAKERNESARYYYIAGQLYQELQQPSGAAKAFESAIAARPTYELELGARLNLAQNAYLSGTGTAEEALKRLERMAREDKNIPYESQILFSMAAIALRNGDVVAGQGYLREALDSPSAGPVQRMEAYKLLGDLAYQDSDYLEAKLYYDTTLTVMQQGDSRYPVTLQRRDQLNDIAENLLNIERKDSLLRIGNMSPERRQEWAEGIFEAQRAEAALLANTATDQPQRGSAPVASIGNSTFFAYNASSLRRGRRDFEREWGDRPLTDDWRRSSRTDRAIFEDEGDATSGDPTEEDVTLITEDEINKILEGIPTTDAARKSMSLQLSQHYFDLGRELRDRLRDNPAAIDAFEALNNRFPEANGEAESWYYLYLIHQEEGNTAKAAEYADKLSRRYRGSKYERLANDPTYAATLKNEENKLMREYEAAYAAFEKGQYEVAHQMAQKGRGELLGQHPLKPRYALLLAMTTGNLQGRAAYVAALRQVVAQFENTPEQTRAKEILRLLGETGARLPGRNTDVGGSFKPSMDQLHYIIVVFNDKEVDLNEAKVSVNKFNNEYNKLDRLRITNVYLGKENDVPALVLRRFKSGQAAMDYLNNAEQNDREFLNAGKFNYDVYAVSQTNYREILKARSVDSYKGWFRENYR
ncbi:tetratricopeptide repeat protein [Lewinella sp. W8]|uniref:type IX secretion system periplasmic lipoprotein PorW/SprE n=1 Tax=Lewinella sp. W8 TaxID=2528208 RepID=UPI0010677767|nr:tetratricopeptide repeat protein [Lewinella sp. W8]MTB53230.1 tetratricopeptide repeat protein [Lewinella sp. W8]